MTELNRIVHEAIGEASMCWEKPEGAGVFQSSKASDIAVRLTADISALCKDCVIQGINNDALIEKVKECLKKKRDAVAEEYKGSWAFMAPVIQTGYENTMNMIDQAYKEIKGEK
jgi:hypothetical protein